MKPRNVGDRCWPCETQRLRDEVNALGACLQVIFEEMAEGGHEHFRHAEMIRRALARVTPADDTAV
jgi:hypothetical protein